MAFSNPAPRGRTLEERFLSLVVAVCAKVMRQFGALCLSLQGVSKHSGSDLVKLIALLLSFPCFEASNFFFKLTYLSNQRKALLQSRRCAALGVYDLRVQFEELENVGYIIEAHFSNIKERVSYRFLQEEADLDEITLDEINKLLEKARDRPLWFGEDKHNKIKQKYEVLIRSLVENS